MRPLGFAGRAVQVVVAAVALTAVVSAPAVADPARCHVQIVKQLLRFNKDYLKHHRVCLERENIGRTPGPCPDATALAKIQNVRNKVVASIERRCSMADIAALGFSGNCALAPAVAGIDATCAALPVTTVKEFVECLQCWKGAELSEFVAILFASHAVDVCGGSLDETSPRCSELDCVTPLPVQRDLGDTGENDCQKAIGRRGTKYLLTRAKVLERCLLAGGTESGCLADLKVQEKLAKAEQVKEVGIQRKCGQRAPNPDPPFCCRTGMANQCTLVATRDDCVTGGGTVQEGKICNGLTCEPVGGPNQKITWWGYCPESDTCPGTPLTTREDMVGCVDSSADRIVDELLCLQFPGTWTCPAD
jgi:hypothetical protein